MTFDPKPFEDTALVLAAFIKQARETGVSDIDLATAIVKISARVHIKALDDRLPDIRHRAQPRA
jgi:hypothetical protein